jgi:hypothetical protein
MRYLKSKIKIRLVFLHIEERIRGLALMTFIALMAYCILEHLAKENLNPKATTHQLMKVFNRSSYNGATYDILITSIKRDCYQFIFILSDRFSSASICLSSAWKL